MPFRKNPRDGQKRVFDQIIADHDLKTLNVQLPTGYGKSFVCCGAYSILKKQNKVNRLLVVVPTTAQREQFCQAGPHDMRDACVEGPLNFTDIGFSGLDALRRHRKNSCQAFTITAQGLIGGSGDLVREIMSTGSWMVVVDEYHHYGIDKSWGATVGSLPYSFMLAMSATPYRKDDDSAFGAPDIEVSYRDAVKEDAVKALEGHSYVYRIDLLGENGDIINMTTSDLIKAAGSCNPTDIQNYVIAREMRWSPKYISPLVAHPIERMISQRITTGFKLQAIIGAMCVKHAKLVCTQVKAMYPELEVDWVGTGPDGRSPDENQKLILKFCPGKDAEGRPKTPLLDVLVHVGMAGEGLDSMFVSEVVHLNKAAINNSNNQENGRAARFLPGVTGHINFDSCSEFAVKGYVGRAVMDAMDFNDPKPDSDEELERSRNEEEDFLPEEPTIHDPRIWNLELDHIDSGAPEIKRMAQAILEASGRYDLFDQVGDPDSELHQMAVSAYRAMRERETQSFDEKAIVAQWQEKVNLAVQKLSGRVLRMRVGRNGIVEKSIPGDIKRRINSQKKYEIGQIENNVDCLRKHWAWLRKLEQDVARIGLPLWLQ